VATNIECGQRLIDVLELLQLAHVIGLALHKVSNEPMLVPQDER
jgi:hypothetical protein